MKKNWKNKLTVDPDSYREQLIRLFSIVLVLILLGACSGKETSHEHDTYTCPMHPSVVSDKPGNCPICGMELVKKIRPGTEVEITEDLSKLIKSPNEVVVSSIKTVKGEYRRIPLSLNVQGIVTYDTRNLATLSSRVSGRLEKVFLKYPYQPVSKGQKIAEIYSPELVTAQREFLFLLENDPGNDALIQSSKERLRLLGVTEQQLSTLIQKKEAQHTFAIYSPYSGYVLSETQQTPAAPMTQVPSASGGGMGDAMGSSSSNTSPSTSTTTPSSNDPLIREGSYVTAGQTLFKVVSSTALRVELNVPGSWSGSIKKGDEASLDFGDHHHQTATIDFIQPFYGNGQEFLTVRIYTSRTENLHIGHLANATLQSSSVESLWVPREAIVDLGTERIVFIKEKNVFKAKKVITGVQADNHVEIKQGLASSDEIAADAHYLVDSESFIKTQK